MFQVYNIYDSYAVPLTTKYMEDLPLKVLGHKTALVSKRPGKQQQ